MNDRKSNITVNIADTPSTGKINLGSDVLVLSAENSCQFKTQDITDFRAYCLKAMESNPNITIFYDEERIVAFDLDATLLRQNVPAIAECKLNRSRALETVLSHIDKNLSVEMFELFLQTMKRFSDSHTLYTIDTLRNMTVQKVRTIVRQKDDRGNFNIQYSSAEHGNQSAAFPTSLVFTVPLFKKMIEPIAFSLELSYSIQETGDTPQLRFKLFNYSIEDDLAQATKSAIDEYVKEFPRRYYGSCQITTSTDEWRYKMNPLQFTLTDD
jgi:hypothetical protein